MRTFRVISTVLMIFSMLLSSAQVVRAEPPPLPANFYGQIHIQAGDGVPTAGVDYVEAYVPGIAGYIARALVSTFGSDLVFTIAVPGDVLDTAGTKEGGADGDPITFMIGSRQVAMGTWHAGSNTHMDLHPPQALFGGYGTVGAGVTIYIDGGSFDYAGNVILYEWDLDNDGYYDDDNGPGIGTYYSNATAGTYTIGFRVTDSQYGIGKASAIFFVYTLAGLSGQVYDGAAHPVTASGIETPYSYNVTYNGSATAPTNAGTYVVVVHILNGATEVATITDSLVIAQASQTISVGTHAPASAVIGASFTVAATASSGLTVAYSSGSPTICSVTDATFTMLSGTGTCVVQYDQLGNTNYSAASQVIENVSAQPASQTISVGTHAPASAAFGASFTVAATASSGLTVAYSSGSPTICSVTGATFTMLSGTGTCVVQYDQLGNANYSPASQVIENVSAQPVSQTISVGTHTPASAAFGTSFTVAATASSGLTVAYSSGSPTICSVTGATFTMLSGTGTCVVQYDQIGNTNYSAASQVIENVSAQLASQTISVGTHAPASAAFGASFTVAATASSGLTVAYSSGSPATCSVTGATFTMLSGTGTCVVQYDQLGNANYSPATQVIENVTAQPVSQAITVGTHAPANAAFGASFTVAATASSGLTVAYSSGSPAICSVTGATFTMLSGTGTCVVQYDQLGNANYSAATQVIENVTAQPVSQTITVGTHAPASAAFGASFTVAATASSGLTVAYSSGSPAICSITGATFTMLSGTGTCVVQYDQLGNANYSAASQVIENVTAMALHSITLQPGWNLVSFAIHPAVTTTASVLASISGNYDLVYAWDASGASSGSGNWLRYDPAHPELSTLIALNETQGFWIHVTAITPVNLVVSGTFPTTTNIPLLTTAGGWNLVGYPSATSVALPGALIALGEDYSLVFTYHAVESSDPWKMFDRLAPAYANDLDEIAPGWGYWINVSNSVSNWNVSY